MLSCYYAGALRRDFTGSDYAIIAPHFAFILQIQFQVLSKLRHAKSVFGYDSYTAKLCALNRTNESFGFIQISSLKC